MEHRRIICCGDSNTYGYDPRSCLGLRYPAPVRWTALLEAEGWKVFNDGHNGRCIPRADWEIAAAVQKIRQSKAELAVIMLGTNDMLQRPDLGAEACARRMEKFLDALLQPPSPPFKTLLIAPPPVAPGAWAADDRLLEESRRLGECYEKTARRMEIGFADAGKWGVGLAYDGVHFSEQGHRAFYQGISKLLKGAPPCPR